MLNKLKGLFQCAIFFLSWLVRIKGYGISILVPLHLTDPNDQRAKNWEWLRRYWRTCLPGAEIIIGKDKDAIDKGTVFSKSVAINDAASKAHGNVFVLLDADAYLPADSITYCAKEIRLAQKKKWKLWFVPYRKLYRLSEGVSNKLLQSDPKHLFPISTPPRDEDFTNKGTYENTPISCIGHWYGAMVQIMSRSAFETVGGWDPRFTGWGGEDHAAMAAMDTLYSPHKTLSSAVFHLWHPILVSGTENDKENKRMWANQTTSGNNNALSGRYYYSQGNPLKMRKLVDEFIYGDKVSKEAVSNSKVVFSKTSE